MNTQDIPLHLIDESPTNPRKRFDPAALAELAASIAAKGLISPVIVRAVGERYELVVGARRFRGSGLAGCSTIPAFVRELTDREVCELQIDENGKREDVHPLEEADAFARLHDEHKVPVEEIAHRIGTHPSFVYNRLALARLCPEARVAFTEGKILGGVAQRLARLPVATQARAIATLTKPRWVGGAEVWGLRDALGWIEQHCILELARAPFDPEDAALVPAAGRCSACPKNSSAQTSLFGEVSDVASCMDSACHKAKVDADWAIKTADKAAAGLKVLPADQQFWGEPVDGRAWRYGGEKTWPELLGKHAPTPVVVNRDGTPTEVYDRLELAEAIEASGLDKKTAEVESRSARTDWETERRRRKALTAAVLSAAQGALDRRTGSVDTSRADWQWAASLVAHLCSDDVDRVAEEIGTEDLVNDEIPNLSASGCHRLMLSLAFGEYEPDGVHELVARWLGLDLAVIEKQVEEAEQAPAPKPAAAEATAGKPAGKKASTKKATPVEPGDTAAVEPPPPSATVAEPAEAPEVRVWIAAHVWDTLSLIERAELEEPLAGCGVDWTRGTDWLTAMVPDDELLVALNGICGGLGVKLHVSETCPVEPIDVAALAQVLGDDEPAPEGTPTKKGKASKKSAVKLYRDQGHTLDAPHAHPNQGHLVIRIGNGVPDQTHLRPDRLDDATWRRTCAGYIDDAVEAHEVIEVARLYSSKGKCVWDLRDNGGRP